jgi:hypothetical protein
LIALGSITESPDKQTFSSVIIPSLNNLLAMFTDQNSKVREAIAWVFYRICEDHYQIISNQSALDLIIKTMLNQLVDKPKISALVCKSIE